MQFIFVSFVTGIGQVVDLGARDVRDHLGQVAHTVGFGHLIENLYPLTRFRCIFQSNLDTSHGVLYVNEGAGLAASAMNGERIVNCRLHEETIQYGPVIAIVIEAIDEPLVEPGFLCLGAPYDSLVQVGNAHPIVLVVEKNSN